MTCYNLFEISGVSLFASHGPAQTSMPSSEKSSDGHFSLQTPPGTQTTQTRAFRTIRDQADSVNKKPVRPCNILQCAGDIEHSATMQITRLPPGSSPEPAKDPGPADYGKIWQTVCDRMSTRISGYFDKKQVDQMNGYVSNMYEFINGIAAKHRLDPSPELKALLDATLQLTKDTKFETNEVCQKDLQSIRNMFPPNIKPNEVKAGFARILDLGSHTVPVPPQTVADYCAGLRDALSDLPDFASTKDRNVITSPDLLDPLNNFIEDPNQTTADALNKAMNDAIDQL